MIRKRFLSWNEMQQSSCVEKIETTYGHIGVTYQGRNKKCCVFLEAKSVNLVLIIYIWILVQVAECSNIRFFQTESI